MGASISSQNQLPASEPDTASDTLSQKSEKSTSVLEESAPEKQSASDQAPEGEADERGGEGEVEEEEEEEGECGFCLFMKGGGCKDTFVEWEKCVEMGEKNKEDIVEKCFQATAALRKCMEAHSEYYGPLLQAEKDAEEEFSRQVEEEKKLGDGEGGTQQSASPMQADRSSVTKQVEKDKRLGDVDGGTQLNQQPEEKTDSSKSF